MFFLVGRVLGKRQQGLFGPTPAGVGGEEGLEFGYCFDVNPPCLNSMDSTQKLMPAGLDPRLSTHLGLSLHPTVSLFAAYSSRLRRLQLLRQYNVPHGIVLLLYHHIPRL